MTPRELRKALAAGKWRSTTTPRKLPYPPKHWSLMRQGRMAVAIQAAKLFFFHNHEWTEIRARLYEQRMIEEQFTSRQRIQQYVDKGMKFLVQFGVFVKSDMSNVGQKTAAGTQSRSGE